METRTPQGTHTVVVALRDKQSLESLMDLAFRMAKTMEASIVAIHVV